MSFEVIKVREVAMINMLHKIFSTVWKTKIPPKDWLTKQTLNIIIS